MEEKIKECKQAIVSALLDTYNVEEQLDIALKILWTQSQAHYLENNPPKTLNILIKA